MNSLRVTLLFFYSSLLGGLATGCASFAPPTPELLQQLPDLAGRNLRATLAVHAELPQLSGVFEGVLVVRPAPYPSIRLQLYPDIGGKVLDIAANAAGVTIYTESPPRTWSFEEGRPPRELLLPVLLAVTLQEHFAPLRPRLEGARRSAPDRLHEHGWELQLSPHPLGIRTRTSFPESTLRTSLGLATLAESL